MTVVPWTSKQKGLVETMVGLGASTEAIAAAVDHTKSAVSNHLYREALKRTPAQRASILKGHGNVSAGEAVSAQRQDGDTLPQGRQLSEAGVARLYAGRRYDCSADWNREARKSYCETQRKIVHFS